MERFWVDIVGLTHSDVESYYKEYAQESVGRQLTLMRDEVNPTDPFAVKAKERDCFVGYVASADLDIALQALHGSNVKRLKATVVNASSDPPLLHAQVECAAVDRSFDPYASLPYDEWEWPALMLLPKSLVSVSERADDLVELLENEKPDWNSVRALFLEFLTDSPSDTSREMNATRQLILQLLEQHSQQAATEEESKRWTALATQLRILKGQLMNHDTRNGTARSLFIRWPQQLKRLRFEQSHYTFDNRLDELEARLQAFPFHLYDTFLNDPVDFLRETFYKHVPRRQLYGLLSGIVLMVLKGRVCVRRWGRDDDHEMCRQLEAVVDFKEEKNADRADRSDQNPAETADRADRSDQNPAETADRADRSDQNPAETADRTDRSDQNPAETADRADRVDQNPAETADRADRSDQNPAEIADRADRSDQRTILKRALHRLLTENGPGGKPLVRRQNQWAAIAFVLINEYDLPFELTDFCREMEAWGFGEEGDYAVPCVYTNVAKYSIYVVPEFEKREKKSLADNRQWTVVEGLRKLIAEEQAIQHSS